MAFGKITVAAESGDIEEHDLTRPTTSVGRQPGNDIVLNSSAVSRYHAQFDVYGGQVFLVDLGTVNGTFINDQQVEPNSRNLLKDGDVVMLGDMRLIFNATKRRPGGTGLLVVNPKVHEDPNVALRLTLDDPNQPVAPGAFLQLALVIENLSGVERLFTIQTDGMDQEWLKINRREVRLENEEQTEVMISVRPPRMSTTRPGHYPLTIRVAFKDDPTQVVEALRDIDVLNFGGIAMAVREGQNGLYSLAVQNQGNHPIEIQLSGYQPDKLLSYHFEPARLWIEPGDTAQVRLKARAARSAAQRVIPFAVVAHSRDDAAFQAPLIARLHLNNGRSTRTGRAVVIAGLGIPVLFLLGLLLVVAGLAGLWALGYINLPIAVPGLAPAGVVPPQVLTATSPGPTTTPPPTAIPTPMVQIQAFTATPTQITFGTVDKIVFTWQIDGASNVKDYALKEADGGELIPLPAPAWVTGRLEVTSATLVRNFGWDQHDFTLTVTGIDGIPRSSTVPIKISPVKCELQTGATITSSPTAPGTPTPIAPPPSKEVVIGGRTADSAWIRLWGFAEHAPLGWVPVRAVVCPLTTPLSQFVVVQP